MRKILVCGTLLFSGCGPLAIDMTVGWGANQSIEKTLKMDQKQTKAQTEAGSDFWEGLFDVLPLIAATPQPTPLPKQQIKSITIEVAQPVAEPIIVEDRIIQIKPKLPPAKKKPKEDICRCELGSGNLCTYHNDRVTCEPVK